MYPIIYTTWDVQNLVNNGINYQPQRMIVGFLNNQHTSSLGGIFVHEGKFSLFKSNEYLGGGFNPFEKYQIGSFPQEWGEERKYLKPPPSVC